MSYTPPVGYHFRVEFSFLDSDNDTRFQEVSGLSAEIASEDVVEGGENRFTHRLPVRTKYGNLTLKRGLLTSSQLIDWVKHAVESLEASDKYKPTDVTVTLLDEAGEPLDETYSFSKAWPVKWSISDLKASENALVIETLELSYNYFRRVPSQSGGQ